MNAGDRPDVETLRPLIVRLWTETLDLPRFDPTQSWEEAGADSLATLHLLLKIETALGLKLGFETILPDMTAAAIAAAVAGARPRVAGPAGPQVFFLTGLFGYEQPLVDFQTALRERLSLEIVGLPDLSQPISDLASLRATARLVASDIARRQPDGDLFLAGLCFGGTLAVELAVVLAEAGRRVAFLGILDGPIVAPHWRSKGDRLLDARVEAVRSWRPERLRRSVRPAVCLLVMSEEYAPRFTRRWRKIVPKLRVVGAPGDHQAVLRAALSTVVPAFAQAVLDAAAPSRTALARRRLAAWISRARRPSRDAVPLSGRAGPGPSGCPSSPQT